MSARNPIFNQKVLTGVSAADATGLYNVPTDIVAQAGEWTLIVVFDATAGAGAVLLESCHDYNYSGKWATEATASWAEASAVVVKHLTAANRALRVRVSSAVTSGTADVYLIGLPHN